MKGEGETTERKKKERGGGCRKEKKGEMKERGD